jgi:hypothetical protein
LSYGFSKVLCVLNHERKKKNRKKPLCMLAPRVLANCKRSP